MRNYRGPPTLCGTTPSFPSLLLRQGEKKDSLLERHQGTTIPQTLLFSPTWTSPTCSYYYARPRWLRIVIRTRRTSHTNCTPWNDFHFLKILGPRFWRRPAHVSSCNFKDACCGEASFSTAGRLTPARVHVLNDFVSPCTHKCCPPSSVSPRELNETNTATAVGVTVQIVNMKDTSILATRRLHLCVLQQSHPV